MKVKTHKKCKTCWKEFKIFSTTDKFCTKKCMNELEKQKRAKVREKKKTSVSTLTKVADKLWSDVVKLEWGNKCAYCWKTDYLNSHHLFTRARKATRFDIENWICLCSGCHTLSSTFSAHQTSLEFFLWLEEKYGRDWIEKRKVKSLTIIKVTPEFIQNEIDNLKEIKNKHTI